MRKIVLISVIIAALISIVSTMMQIQPALFIIEKVVDSDGRFSVTLVLALTFLLFALPLVLISYLLSSLRTVGNKKESFQTTLDGSGIIVERKRALYGAAFALDVLVNDEKKASVMLGKKVAISLPDGTHQIKVIAMKHPSPAITVEIGPGQVKHIECGFETGGTMKDVYIREKK